MSVTALQTTTYQGIWRNEAPTQFSNSDKSIASPSFNSNPEIFPLTGFNRIISMSGATSVTLTSWLEMNMAMVDGHVAESVGNQEKTTGDDSPRLPPNFWDFRNSIRWFCDFVVLLLIASCKWKVLWGWKPKYKELLGIWVANIWIKNFYLSAVQMPDNYPVFKWHRSIEAWLLVGRGAGGVPSCLHFCVLESKPVNVIWWE